ncbi:hypothetical protein ACIQPP_13905 [Streptomyces violaceusniger]|uniref:hypothetical protein n=1 Tax=Streptomyces violaceusniger TaxID=68280 RepID=UPI000998868E|nr:hypothetical protein [Streptomyces hygroscopicus]AQW51777.1 hypothetical protein SHXM_05240 [Streptomyces hygroscopicus]
MSTLSLRELNAPLLALRLLSVEYAGLPAPRLSVCAIFPDLLDLSFHDDLAGFEAWREVLGIEPCSVEYGEQCDDTRVLTAHADYAGARIRLTGFGQIATGEAA